MTPTDIDSMTPREEWLIGDFLRRQWNIGRPKPEQIKARLEGEDNVESDSTGNSKE